MLIIIFYLIKFNLYLKTTQNCYFDFNEAILTNKGFKFNFNKEICSKASHELISIEKEQLQNIFHQNVFI